MWWHSVPERSGRHVPGCRLKLNFNRSIDRGQVVNIVGLVRGEGRYERHVNRSSGGRNTDQRPSPGIAEVRMITLALRLLDTDFLN